MKKVSNISYDYSIVEKILNIERDEKLFGNEIIKRRFLLKIKLKNRKSENTVVVIMMNPSKADEKVSDRTINKVIKYVFNNDKTKDTGKIVLLNLFVAYKTVPKDINELIEISGFDYVAGNKMCKTLTNDEYIEKEVKTSNLIILAWGKANITKYRDRVNAVLNLLPSYKLYCVKGLTKKGYPRHPRNWSYNWELIKYKQALRTYKS